MRPTVENQRSTDRERRASHGRITGSNLAGAVNAPMRDSAPAGARVNGVAMAEGQSIQVNDATSNVARDVAPTYRISRVAIRVVGDESQPTDATVMDSRSTLDYVGIVIHGIHGSHAALYDNGSEINLINRELVQQLSNLPTMGRIKIKGVVGPAVETDLTLFVGY